MKTRLVTIATFATATEANIVRNVLLAEGIPAFLANENTVDMVWTLGNALGGIKLQVAEQDVVRAEAILDDHDAATITEEDWKADPPTDRDDASPENEDGPRDRDDEEDDEYEDNSDEQDDATDVGDEADNDVEHRDEVRAQRRGKQGRRRDRRTKNSSDPRVQLDETVNRAFRAAVLGLLLLPLQLYSLWLLVGLTFRFGSLNAAQGRRYLYTIMLNAPMFLIGSLIISRLLSRSL